MRLELPIFRSASPFPCGKLLAGFCCQAPAGLRLGRYGHRREIVVICDSSKFGGDKGAYHARPRSHHPDRIDPNSPPSKIVVIRVLQRSHSNGHSRLSMVEAAGIAPASPINQTRPNYGHIRKRQAETHARLSGPSIRSRGRKEEKPSP